MRIKRSQTKRNKHKKILDLAKGYRMSYSKLFKRAHEAVMHAGQYSFNDRHSRLSQFREIWIERINAALMPHNEKYGTFINKLKVKKVELNRKVLSALALDFPEVFGEVVKAVK
jgi:large subunit ribosomal protein L20